jgi:Raf kinase inhibitor-like YbhB/YbcL family protein
MIFTIRSHAFEEGGAIPTAYTCDGADRSPPLSWSGAPAGTRALALIVHDPDAPAGDWVHWLLYDVPAERHELPEAVPAQPTIAGTGTQGLNDFRRIGWGGPCPPRGAAHRYRFRLLALDTTLGLPPRLTRDALLEAAHGHVLAEASTMGSYARR